MIWYYLNVHFQSQSIKPTYFKLYYFESFRARNLVDLLLLTHQNYDMSPRLYY